MSKINVNNIEANDASTDITVTTGGSQSLLVDTNGKLTVAGNLSVNGNNYPSAGPLSNRNLIINGAMQVAQRGTSATGVASTGYHACDRWKDAGSLATRTITQESDGPAGFANSYKIEITTANASPTALSSLTVTTIFEGQNLQSLKKGTSEALQATLSFWVKSNKTGTYIVEFDDNDNSRNINKAYTVNTVDTWEYKTVTFDADTTGAFDNDANDSSDIFFWLDAGSDFRSGTLATSWETSTNANRAVGNVSFGDTVGNYWQITGVQLEVGDTATPFEHRSYGDELARCQRYFYKAPAEIWMFGLTGPSGTSYGRAQVNFKKTMRATPTATYTFNNASNVGSSGLQYSSADQLYIYGNSLTGLNAISAGATFDAEL